MVERKPRRGLPVPSDIAPTRAVPLLQAQPVRWWRGAERGSDLAITRPYLQRPSAGIRRAALPLLALLGVACGAASAFIAVQRSDAVTGMFRRLISESSALLTPPAGLGAPGGSSTTATASTRAPELPDPFGAPSDCSPAADAAERLARGAYPQALAAYRALARAHPEQRVYAAIAELIEGRLAARGTRPGRGRRRPNPSPPTTPMPSQMPSPIPIQSPMPSAEPNPIPPTTPILTLTPIPEPASDP